MLENLKKNCKKCAACKFFESRSGFCRKNPPQVIVNADGDYVAAFPINPIPYETENGNTYISDFEDAVDYEQIQRSADEMPVEGCDTEAHGTQRRHKGSGDGNS